MAEKKPTLDMKKAHEAIKRIAKNGEVTAEKVVETARNPKHVLHDYFEWDDRKAAHSFRVDQARTLLADVRYEIVERNLTCAIQWVRNPNANPATQGYISTVTLGEDENAARTAVVNELNHVVAYLRRARDLGEAVGVQLDILDILHRTEALSLQLRALRIAG